MSNEEIIKQRLLDLAKEWSEAIVSNDAESIGRFMADDWQMVSWSGSTGKKQFLSFIASGDLTHSAMDLVAGTESVRFYGDTAILTGRVTNTAHYKGEEFPADEWTSDVFIKISGDWKCVLSHITPAEKSK